MLFGLSIGFWSTHHKLEILQIQYTLNIPDLLDTVVRLQETSGHLSSTLVISYQIAGVPTVAPTDKNRKRKADVLSLANRKNKFKISTAGSTEHISLLYLVISCLTKYTSKNPPQNHHTSKTWKSLRLPSHICVCHGKYLWWLLNTAFLLHLALISYENKATLDRSAQQWWKSSRVRVTLQTWTDLVISGWRETSSHLNECKSNFLLIILIFLLKTWSGVELLI